jgi:hypothetical protein
LPLRPEPAVELIEAELGEQQKAFVLRRQLHPPLHVRRVLVRVEQVRRARKMRRARRWGARHVALARVAPMRSGK